MKTLLICLWLICGFIALWREYHGSLKEWYRQFNESYWDFHRREGSSAISMLIWHSPLVIIGGLFSLLILETDSQTKSWYFTTKNKQKQL